MNDRLSAIQPFIRFNNWKLHPKDESVYNVFYLGVLQGTLTINPVKDNKQTFTFDAVDDCEWLQKVAGPCTLYASEETGWEITLDGIAKSTHPALPFAVAKAKIERVGSEKTVKVETALKVLQPRNLKVFSEIVDLPILSAGFILKAKKNG